MDTEFIRFLPFALPQGQSAFLWGPRKTGKSTFLKKRFPRSVRFDLLKSDLYLEILKEPARLRMRIESDLARGVVKPAEPIVIDEVQKVPAILDDVHWLIEEKGCCFIMCGSSARKLKRGHANMLGGRAWRFEMHPLTSVEIPQLNLLRALNNGLLPSHYLQENSQKSLQAYVQDYLKEEIIAEGLSRNIPAFTRFMDILGFCNGEQIVFSNIARDTGVNAKTVQEYFQILADTMIGTLISPFSRKGDRNIITATPKFYLFDVGLSSFLNKTLIAEERGSAFGRAFEHFIFMELRAHRSYTEMEYPISYWRTDNGYEVDFILGNGQVAIEVKSASNLTRTDLKGLLRFIETYQPEKAIVVTNEKAPRKIGDLHLLPWRDFLGDLWGGKIIS